MREPNFSSPTQNKAAIVISSTLYDRRALDCTATLPLVNSLTHLAYMTSTSPRMREILTSDGGLERLVKILATSHNTDKHSLWKWSLAFQCVVNIGVRGTETIRTRVVEVGAVHVILAILENFLRALGQAKLEKEQERTNPNSSSGLITNGHNTSITATTTTSTASATPTNTTTAATTTTATNNTALSLPTMPLPPHSRSTPVHPSRRLFSIYPSSANTTDDSETTISPPPTTVASSPTMSLASSHLPPPLSSGRLSFSSSPPFTMPKRRTFLPHGSVKQQQQQQKSRTNKDSNLSSIPLLNSLAFDAVLHREEDILLSLQLLAYLSKYPHIRNTFHNDHRHNVFSVVEKFTHRIHPQTIIYWAGVIMRNACRKDESQGGIRQCAYMHCGKWERYPREFAKCRRCRKAKYCSKTCQSRAWAEGHRWWCVERTHTSHPPNMVSTTTAAATAAVVAAATAAPPPPPEDPLTNTEQIGSLDGVDATTTHIPLNMDETRTMEHQQQQQMQQQQQPHHHHHHNHHHHHVPTTAIPQQDDDMDPAPAHHDNRQQSSLSGQQQGARGSRSRDMETEEEEEDDEGDDRRQYNRHDTQEDRRSLTNHNTQQPQQQQQQRDEAIGSSLPPPAPADENISSDRLLSPNQQSLLFYHRRRRHSRSAQSLASGSSTEVEADTTLQPDQQDLMEID
ncbi:hypothetical protein [Absidia glauca]|uniref:MYND-type domain-containing protein n=1 Tax=Absidia glauca TaxID=4829 RepID=A0A163J1W9_ABSGL|nr:hypothetical protein [Absidia glauca]